MRSCRSCDLIARRDRDGAPDWDGILRTPGWDVVHAYDTSLPGWLVLVVRRHVEAVADLTAAEALELGELLRQASIALQAATGCSKTYVAQFAEAAEHPHVHFHVIPRMSDQPSDARGPAIFQRYLGVPESERVPQEQMNAIAQTVSTALLSMRE